MTEPLKQDILKEFRRIPGIGKSIAEDLWNLGLRSVQDLRDRNPEELYATLCLQQGQHVDRCMLYVFRCAVYYASHEMRDPELLKWWNWKDEKISSGDDPGARPKGVPGLEYTDRPT